MRYFSTAEKRNIKVGNFVLLKYDNSGPYNWEPAYGGKVLHLLLQDQETGYVVYDLIEIKKVKNGKIDITGYDTNPPGDFFHVDSDRIIKDYKKYTELFEEAKNHIKEPAMPYNADQEVEWHTKLETWTNKEFMNWKDETNPFNNFRKDKLVFTTDMLTPVDLKDAKLADGYGAAFVIVTDGKFEVELDNEHILMPKVLWLSKTGKQYLKSEGSWGKKENISPDTLVGLHTMVEDKEWDSIFQTYYEDDDEHTGEAAVIDMLIYPNIQMECDRILHLMKTNQKTLCKSENMPFLGYLMLRWQNLYYAGRICFGYDECLAINPMMQCTNNPKYEFEDMADNDKNENVIYDAWGAGISMESTLPPEWLDQFKGLGERQIQFNEKDFDDLAKYFDASDDFTTLLYKKNKTMDDWYTLLLNPKYRYNSLYKTKHRIDDHLLCTIGNGYGWNKQGFLTNDGPSGEDEADYGKFPMLKGHATGSCAKIEKQLNKILFQPHVQKTLDISRDWFLEASSERLRKDIVSRSSLSSPVFDLVYGLNPVRDPEENNQPDNERLWRGVAVSIALSSFLYSTSSNMMMTS